MSVDTNGNGTGTVEPIWKQRGFDSEEAMGKEFDKAKGDIAKFKDKIKSLEPLATKATEYEELIKKAEEDKKSLEASKTTEIQKMQESIANLTKQIEDSKKEVAAKEREMIYEREVSSKISKYPEEHGKLVRKLYKAEAYDKFTNSEDLSKMLDEIDKEWLEVHKADPSRPSVPGQIKPPSGNDSKISLDTFRKLEEKSKRGPK